MTVLLILLALPVLACLPGLLLKPTGLKPVGSGYWVALGILGLGLLGGANLLLGGYDKLQRVPLERLGLYPPPGWLYAVLALPYLALGLALAAHTAWALQKSKTAEPDGLARLSRRMWGGLMAGWLVLYAILALEWMLPWWAAP